MIFLTGDTHGHYDIHKLNSGNFSVDGMTKDDYVIILGDFGLLWYPYGSIGDKRQQYWLDWLENKPFTTLFVDGNHENHKMLYELPIVEKFGGKVGKVRDSIFHLKRGEIYVIDSQKFFVMGGAQSIDKASRTVDISWWEAELPTTMEFEYGFQNLEKHKWCVDYILGHNCPIDIGKVYFREMNDRGDDILKQRDVDVNLDLTGQQLAYLSFDDKYYADKLDTVGKYFTEVVKKTKFNKFYFGHYHSNWCTDDDNYIMLFDDVVLLDEIKKEWKSG